MLRRCLIIIAVIAFLICTTFFYGNNITCNKASNKCIVRSSFNNQITDSFDYNNINQVYHIPTKHGSILTFEEYTKFVDGENGAMSYYKPVVKHQTLRFSSLFGIDQLVCENVRHRFLEYQSSENNEFSARSFDILLFEVLILTIIVYTLRISRNR